MASFREKICEAACKGKKYPRQCRNSEPWRRDKLNRYDDIYSPEFSCPYGLQLGFLKNEKRRPAASQECRYLGKRRKGCCTTLLFCAQSGEELPVLLTDCLDCEHKEVSDGE